jgi:hypothetical protein
MALCEQRRQALGDRQGEYPTYPSRTCLTTSESELTPRDSAHHRQASTPDYYTTIHNARRSEPRSAKHRQMAKCCSGFRLSPDPRISSTPTAHLGQLYPEGIAVVNLGRADPITMLVNSNRLAAGKISEPPINQSRKPRSDFTACALIGNEGGYEPGWRCVAIIGRQVENTWSLSGTLEEDITKADKFLVHS